MSLFRLISIHILPCYLWYSCKQFLLNSIFLSVLSGKALRCLSGQIIQIIPLLAICIFHLFDGSFSFCGYFPFSVKKTNSLFYPFYIFLASTPLVRIDFHLKKLPRRNWCLWFPKYLAFVWNYKNWNSLLVLSTFSKCLQFFNTEYISGVRDQ